VLVKGVLQKLDGLLGKDGMKVLGEPVTVNVNVADGLVTDGQLGAAPRPQGVLSDEDAGRLRREIQF
jgi:hypothetical protein